MVAEAIKSSTSKLKVFLAMSRTQHGIIDATTPALVALLFLGYFPSLHIMVIGMIAAIAGYTAIYALNDFVDRKVDQEKMANEEGDIAKDAGYLDAAMVRHPLAQNIISQTQGLAWIGFWFAVSFAAAYALNPVSAFILVVAAVLEIIYCKLFKVTHWRILASGVVKTCGSIAAVFAVQAHPPVLPLVLMFIWLFLWEVGGQNIPADWTDIGEDKSIAAKTLPIVYGAEKASFIIFVSLAASVVASCLLLALLPHHFSTIAMLAFAVVGVYVLLMPAYRLFQTKAHRDCVALFNKASHYPFVLLLVVVLLLN